MENNKTIAEKIKYLIDEKAEEINRNKYFTLTIKVQNGHPVIMKQEVSLRPDAGIEITE